ncbi:hypothetical protein ASY01nite_14010 [Acetobacter syzygii]|uniref:hypothetical protein n=1 Tax=Acetobacter TaxID=434 RepID=UPI0005DEF4C4|nr:hypothetical protein [Acetobacter syzygii]GAN72115.1 hypothetical protein Absy_030_023 [Acetobacter syzygii]GBR64927.1 hypothetical protein AA0483_1604 [Acetobacter syzygii NRIC 0483]GEL56335.1 hypothetical protein ASY01nite_14010 [Acetobacter syzygii]
MSGTASGNPVTVGCKLPNGLTLRVGEHKVILSGANASRVIGGYGLTSVPSDLWDAWSKAHAETPLIKRRIVFAEATTAKAEGRAKEQEAVKTGLEPLSPDDSHKGVEKLSGG